MPNLPTFAMTPPETPPPGIALFDMDGTLLAWDCQLLFRHHVLKEEPARYYSVPLFLAFLPFAKLLGTENMKRVFHSFLWKMPPERLAELSRSFAEKLQPSIYHELKERLAHHKQAGHLTILSSASPECYATEVGKLLGFDISLGTVLENTRLFPDLTNHKGANKVARLRELLPPSYFKDGKLANSCGYTDSTADLPMLSICETATLVNPKAELTAIGEKNDWLILRPIRPWKSDFDKGWRVLALLLALCENPAKL
ncbi:haloacid dehalogenase-like hydrolase [Akkermansiaceae bacterium]|nr:haloacid dehalogenase-like hydrolase [Akkermansiaceae bacterium]